MHGVINSRSKSTPLTFDRLSNALHHEWRADRARRQVVPLTEACRGCLGLGAMLQDYSKNVLMHDEHHILFPAEAVTFVGVRDIPSGHFPSAPAMNRRDVNYVTTGTTKVHYGTPLIDLSSPRGLDFKFHPFGKLKHGVTFGGRTIIEGDDVEHPLTVEAAIAAGDPPVSVIEAEADGDTLNSTRDPRLFAVLNKISTKMTDYAFGATDFEGRPYRETWYRKQAPGGKKFHLQNPERFMPQAFVAVADTASELVYAAATASASESWCLECPACRARFPYDQVRAGNPRFSPNGNFIGEPRFFEDGSFVAECPGCYKFRKWHLEDAISTQENRRFNYAFRRGFVKAVADGLPLRASEPIIYQGTLPGFPDTGPRLVGHRFKSENTGRCFVVYLPRWASLKVISNGTPEEARCGAGQVYAKLLSNVNHLWTRQRPDEQWRSLSAVCGGPEMVGVLQQLWFESQALRPKKLPNLVLYPSALMASAGRQLDIRGVYWNFAHCFEANHYLSSLKAFVFPALRLTHWNKLQVILSGDVCIDARVTDLRFSQAFTPAPSFGHGPSLKLRHQHIKRAKPAKLMLTLPTPVAISA